MIEILAVYYDWPFAYYIVDIDHDDEEVTYYYDGMLVRGRFCEDSSGFLDAEGETIPFDECVRTGTKFGLPYGTTLDDVTNNL